MALATAWHQGRTTFEVLRKRTVRVYVERVRGTGAGRRLTLALREVQGERLWPAVLEAELSMDEVRKLRDDLGAVLEGRPRAVDAP